MTIADRLVDQRPATSATPDAATSLPAQPGKIVRVPRWAAVPEGHTAAAAGRGDVDAGVDLVQRCALGENCCNDCRAKPSADFTISTPGDADEQEARQLARSALDAMPSSPVASHVDANRVALSGDHAVGVPTSVPGHPLAGLGAGHPLPAGTRDLLGPRLGVDTRGVRIHTGPAADRNARDLGARAYTFGRDIVFADARYNPDTRAGLELLAHELAHVRQHATHPAPTVLRDETGATAQRVLKEPDGKAALLAGRFAKTGDFTEKPSGEFISFVDSTLQELLRFYAVTWAGLAISELGQLLTPAQLTSPPAGGHSGGKGVESHPKWVHQFQNKLIAERPTRSPGGSPAQQTISESALAAQQLLRAYLSAWSVKKRGMIPGAPQHSSIDEFFRYIGASETNRQAGPLGGSGTENWCDTASNLALARGLMRQQLRYAIPLPVKFDESTKRQRSDEERWQIELRNQAAQTHKWSQLPGHQTGGPGASNETAAYTAALFPGDIITIIGQETPAEGHVATVVDFEGDAITMVSGNARGTEPAKGAVRVEQTIREIPPAEYSYSCVTGACPKIIEINKEVKEVFAQLENATFSPGAEVDPDAQRQLETLGRRRDRLIKHYQEMGRNIRPGRGRSWVVVIRHASLLNPLLLQPLLATPAGQAKLLAEHNLVPFPTPMLNQQFPTNDL